jgi:hypothetical protein
MKLFKRSDIIFTVAIAAAALIIWGLFAAAPLGERAVIMLDGKQIASLWLDEDTIYTVRGEYTNVLEVKDGVIFVWESDCPNQICVKEGAISKSGQAIVCAPNKMTVTITGGEEGGVDAITQ